jgi:hypothetical protein
MTLHGPIIQRIRHNSHLSLIIFAGSILGCTTVRQAKIETSDPIGTTYWGTPAQGLQAGIAVIAPEAANMKGGWWEAPGFRVACKLKSVSGEEIRVPRPVVRQTGNPTVIWISPSPQPREPGWSAPQSSHVLELAPGEEAVVETGYDPHFSSLFGYERTLMFEFENYAAAVIVDGDRGPKTINELWTGRIDSGVISVKVK